MRHKAFKESGIRQSVGLIIARRDSHNRDFEYLLVSRRHTFAYVDFICGRYNISDTSYILKLLSQMTIKERVCLLNTSFSRIWGELWLSSRHNCRGFNKASEKFESVFQKRRMLKTLIEQLPCEWREPEWGFPKGHPEKNEGPIECAIREVYEETLVRSYDYVVLPLPHVDEVLRGTDGMIYHNIFFICHAMPWITPRLDLGNMNQVQEIGDIQWMSFGGALKKFRHYETQHVRTLIKAHTLMKKFWSNM